MELFEYIKPELLILIPVLNIIGLMIKNSKIKNNYIPLLLTIIAIVFCIIYVWIYSNHSLSIKDLFDTFIQGILIASFSIYNHQFCKQIKEKQ